MKIFGEIFIKSIDGNIYKGKVLVADTFESNDNLKVAMMIDFENKSESFLDTKNVDFIVFRTSMGSNLLYGYVNIERNEDGSICRDLNDIYIEEDYSYGNLSRIHLFVDNEDSIILMNNNFELLIDSSVVNNDIKEMVLNNS